MKMYVLIVTACLIYGIHGAKMSAETCKLGTTQVEAFIKYECYKNGFVRGVRPIGCVPTNELKGKMITDGQSTIGKTKDTDHFWYKCTIKGITATYNITHCIGHDGTKMYPGEKQKDKDDATWICTRLADGTVTLKIKHAEKNAVNYLVCSFNGKEHGEREEWEENKEKLKCYYRGKKYVVRAVACITSDRTIILSGKYAKVKGTYYKCEDCNSDPGNCKLTAVDVVTCTDKSGKKHELNEQWDIGNLRYKCSLDIKSNSGTIEVVGCIYKNTFIRKGQLRTSRNFGGKWIYCKPVNGKWATEVVKGCSVNGKEKKIQATWISGGLKYQCRVYSTGTPYVKIIGCQKGVHFIGLNEIKELKPCKKAGHLCTWRCQKAANGWVLVHATLEEYMRWKQGNTLNFHGGGGAGRGDLRKIKKQEKKSTTMNTPQPQQTTEKTKSVTTNTPVTSHKPTEPRIVRTKQLNKLLTTLAARTQEPTAPESTVPHPETFGPRISHSKTHKTNTIGLTTQPLQTPEATHTSKVQNPPDTHESTTPKVETKPLVPLAVTTPSAELTTPTRRTIKPTPTREMQTLLNRNKSTTPGLNTNESTTPGGLEVESEPPVSMVRVTTAGLNAQPLRTVKPTSTSKVQIPPNTNESTTPGVNTKESATPGLNTHESTTPGDLEIGSEPLRTTPSAGLTTPPLQTVNPVSTSKVQTPPIANESTTSRLNANESTTPAGGAEVPSEPPVPLIVTIPSSGLTTPPLRPIKPTPTSKVQTPPRVNESTTAGLNTNESTTPDDGEFESETPVSLVSTTPSAGVNIPPLRTIKPTSTSKVQTLQNLLRKIITPTNESKTPGLSTNELTTPGLTTNESTTPGLNTNESTTPGLNTNESTTPGLNTHESTTPGLNTHESATPGDAEVESEPPVPLVVTTPSSGLTTPPFGTVKPTSTSKVQTPPNMNKPEPKLPEVETKPPGSLVTTAPSAVCEDMHPICENLAEVCSNHSSDDALSHEDHERVRRSVSNLAHGVEHVMSNASEMNAASVQEKLKNYIGYPNADCHCPKHPKCPWYCLNRTCPNPCECDHNLHPTSIPIKCNDCDTLKEKTKKLIMVFCPKTCNNCTVQNEGKHLTKVVYQFLEAWKELKIN